jgi:hypothetical protein
MHRGELVLVASVLVVVTESGHRQNRSTRPKPPPDQDICTLARTILQDFQNSTRESMSAITGAIDFS